MASRYSVRANPYLVYIAGVHTPVVSVQVVYSVYDLPRAQVALVPDPVLDELGRDDNVPVSIWFYDWDAPEGLRDWRLLMSGFIIARTASSSQGQRTVTLTVLDDAALLDFVPLHASMSVENAIGHFVDAASAEKGQNPNFLMPAALFYQGYNHQGGQPIDRPFALLQNALDLLVGNTVHPWYTTQDQASDQDPAIACRSAASVYWLANRLHMTGFLDSVLPCPGLEDSAEPVPFGALEAVSTDTVLAVLRESAGGFGEGDSLWKVLVDLYRRFFYEINCIPAPAAVQYDYAASRVTGVYTGRGRVRIARYVTKPETPFGAIPWFNVLWPSLAQSAQVQDDYMRGPTRVLLSDSWLFNQLPSDPSGQSAAQLHLYAAATGWPPRFNDILDEKLGRGLSPPNPRVNPHATLATVEELFRGPRALRLDTPTPLAVLVAVNNTSQDIPAQGQTESDAGYLQRLEAFAVQVTEATQQLRTLVGTSERLLADTTLPDGERGVVESTLADARKDLDRLVELSSALTDAIRRTDKRTPGARALPVEAQDQTLRDLRATIRATQETLSERGVTIPQDLLGNQTAYGPQSDLERDTRLGYAAYLWATKELEHHGGATGLPFHPYVVPGFPGLVFDRDGSSQPRVVYIVGVSHTMSLGEASTTVSYTYSRTLATMYRMGTTLPAALRNLSIASWPAHPLKQVRDLYQTQEGATTFLSRLFYGAQAKPTHIPDTLYLDPDAMFVTEQDGRSAREVGAGQWAREDVAMQVRDAFEPLMTQPDTAMALAYRPGTSIEQWRALMRQSDDIPGGSPSQEALGIDGPAPYPVVLWAYSVFDPRPGIEDQGTTQVVYPRTAQLRVDWPARLQQYRQRVIDHPRVGPRRL